MATQPYPEGTFPKQFIEGGVSHGKFIPNPGGPNNPYTGGVVFAGGILQDNKLFDNKFGSLAYPYLGIRNSFNENKPVPFVQTGAGFGITTCVPGGSFSSMVRGQYVILTFNTQLASIATTVLQSPGNSIRRGENKNIGWINTTLYNTNGGFYLLNGLPVNPQQSRDNIGVDGKNTYTFNSTGVITKAGGYQYQPITTINNTTKTSAFSSAFSSAFGVN